MSVLLKTNLMNMDKRPIRPSVAPKAYQSFSELLLGEVEGQDFIRVIEARKSPIAIVAIHGGGIEPGTSELAHAIAGRDYSLYCFESLKTSGNELLHIPSHDFDDPLCLNLVASAYTVVSIHGCGGEGQRAFVYIGGRHKWLQDELSNCLNNAGFLIAAGSGRYPGQHRDNVCNLGQASAGIQLEISLGVRRKMFAGMQRPERKITRPVFDHFVQATRAVLRAFQYEAN